MRWGDRVGGAPAKNYADLGDQRTSFFVRKNGSYLPIQALSPLGRMLVAGRCIVRLHKNPTFYRARCVEAFPGLA